MQPLRIQSWVVFAFETATLLAYAPLAGAGDEKFVFSVTTSGI